MGVTLLFGMIFGKVTSLLRCLSPELMHWIFIGVFPFVIGLWFWSVDSLRRIPRDGIEQTQWDELTDLLCDLHLHSFPDRLGWSIDVSDSFSVSSASFLIDSALLFTGSCETRWNNWVRIKLNIFIWRLRLWSIPTRQSLSQCGITLNSIMGPICSTTVESNDNLFTDCIQL